MTIKCVDGFFLFFTRESKTQHQTVNLSIQTHMKIIKFIFPLFFFTSISYLIIDLTDILERRDPKPFFFGWHFEEAGKM